MNLVVALFLIVFQAVHDGLQMKDQKSIAGLIKFFYSVVIALVLFAWVTSEVIFDCNTDTYIVTIIGYILLRFAIYDPIINRIIRQKWYYIGTTKYFDKFQRWFFNKTRIPVYYAFVLIKPICGFWGFSWLMGWRFGIIF